VPGLRTRVGVRRRGLQITWTRPSAPASEWYRYPW